MSPGRSPTQNRGPTMARSRFGPSKVEGGQHGPGPGGIGAEAAEMVEWIVAGTERQHLSAFASMRCDLVRDVVLGTPTAVLAGANAEVLTFIKTNAEVCQQSGEFRFESNFWDRMALSGPADALAGFIEKFTLGGVFEIVGNGIIALTGGLMIWLGAQRTFSRVRR